MATRRPNNDSKIRRNRQGSAGSCSFFVSRLTFEERFPKMIVLIFSAAFFNPIRAEFEKGGNDFA